MSDTHQRPETLVLHAGWRADPTTGSVAVPIHQTTSYQFRDTGHAASLFALQELGNIYTRIMNPTTDVLEQRITALEGGVGALAVASGQAASAYAIQNLARAGDNVVSSTALYGGTWNLFANTLKDQGIEVRFVDPEDPEAFARATDDRTRAYYAETLPNPKLRVFPIAEVAAIGKRFGIPLIMDNTAAPLLVRPLEHGAARPGPTWWKSLSLGVTGPYVLVRLPSTSGDTAMYRSRSLMKPSSPLACSCTRILRLRTTRSRCCSTVVVIPSPSASGVAVPLSRTRLVTMQRDSSKPPA